MKGLDRDVDASNRWYAGYCGMVGETNIMRIQNSKFQRKQRNINYGYVIFHNVRVVIIPALMFWLKCPYSLGLK